MENSKIHVVHVHEKFYPFMGGSTHRLLNLLKEIDFNKFSITVICENSEQSERESVHNGIKIIRFEKYLEIPKILQNINKQCKIDIVHSHNFRPSFFSFFVNKFVIKSPYIIELHSIYDTTNKIKQSIGNFITKKADRIVVLSNRSKNYLIDKLRITPGKIKVIYNGIYINFTESPFEYNDVILNKKLNDSNLIKLVYIGSLDAFQGIDNIIEVINKTKRKDIFFIIIGGKYDEIEKVNIKLTNTNVYTSAYIDSKYVQYIYKNSDALMVLRPSMLSTETAVPLKPLEALVNNCKILSTKVGGMLELDDMIDSNDILFFDDIDSVINYLNKVQKLDLKISKDVNINVFNVVNQSKLMSQLYEELYLHGK
jgi:glycosyltransferase involved in cell wall biosynthesis